MLPHIAFIGKAGAGKSTAAELLVKHHGYERLSFAAPLKVACGTTTDRGLLQRVGQGVRELHADFLVNLLVDAYHNQEAEATDSTPPFVIDDCRHPNEALRLKIEGFVIVRVVAARGVRVTRLRANGKLQDEAQLEHESETALDDYEADYRIVNDGWSTDLHADIVGVLNKEADRR